MNASFLGSPDCLGNYTVKFIRLFRFSRSLLFRFSCSPLGFLGPPGFLVSRSLQSFLGFLGFLNPHIIEVLVNFKVFWVFKAIYGISINGKVL